MSAAPNLNAIEVTGSDLPLACPPPSQKLWNSHPKVFLNFDDHGKAKCPYCGNEYVLKDAHLHSHGH